MHLPKGQITTNLLKMLPKETSVIVSSLIRRSEKRHEETSISDINVSGENIKLTISCKHIQGEESDYPYYLITFEEKEKDTSEIQTSKSIPVDINSQYQERIDELEREIQHKNESLQATVEELETSNEELQSSNEELIASNEELQSTNEELQSVNEELYTVNAEHIRKIEELTELNADFDNLLKNTYIGTLFLDKNLVIRKINDVAATIINALPTDVGRPIHHLSLKSLYSDFLKDIDYVTDTLETIEREIQYKERIWYFMRILPYRTTENIVNGIIITFVEITSLKRSQSEFNQLSSRLQSSLEAGEVSWWEWDSENDYITFGPNIYNLLGYKQNEVGHDMKSLNKLVHPDDIEKREIALNKHLTGIKNHYIAEYRIKHKDGYYLWFRDKGCIIIKNNFRNYKMLNGIVMNITKEKQEDVDKLDTELNAENQHVYNVLIKNIAQGLVIQNNNGEFVNFNTAAEKLFGLSKKELKNFFTQREDWVVVKPDMTPLSESDYPDVKARKTKKIIKNFVFGILSPNTKNYIWVNTTSIPFVVNDQVTDVYTIYCETTNAL